MGKSASNCPNPITKNLTFSVHTFVYEGSIIGLGLIINFYVTHKTLHLGPAKLATLKLYVTSSYLQLTYGDLE